MANNDFKIKVKLADNSVTKDDLNDKIFVVDSNGVADKEVIIRRMMAVNPGLEVETLRHVLDLENRVVTDLLLMGMRVNNGLYEAGVQCKGVAHGTEWDPNVNTLYVNLKQGKLLREAIGQSSVVVSGKKEDVMFLAKGENSATSQEGFIATAGRNFTVTGCRIKIAGTDPAVGITLTDSEGTETKITMDMIALNQPSKLIFLIPAGLADGEYTLKITTQYGTSSVLLKTPRSIVQKLYIGETPDPVLPGDGGDDGESPDPIV